MLFYQLCLVLRPVNRSNKKRRLKSVTIRMIKYNTNTSKVPANNTRNSGVSASKLKTSMVSNPSGIQLDNAVMRIPLSTVRKALLSLNSTPNLSKAFPSVFPLMSGTKRNTMQTIQKLNGCIQEAIRYVDDRCVNEERQHDANARYVSTLLKGFHLWHLLKGRTKPQAANEVPECATRRLFEYHQCRRAVRTRINKVQSR